MKSEAPSRRARARRRPASSGGQERRTADAPRKVCTAGRGRSSGRSSAAGAPREVLAPPGELRLQRRPGAAARAARRAKSAYWTGSSGSGDGRPAANARRGPPARANRMPIDQPSETMWCRVRSSACSSAPRRSRSGAQQRPALEVERPLAPPRPPGARPRAPARSSGSAGRSTSGRTKRRRRIDDLDRAVLAAQRRSVVRSASWRRHDLGEAARAGAPGSSGPRRRTAPAGCRSRCPGSAGRGTRAAPGRRRADRPRIARRRQRRRGRRVLRPRRSDRRMRAASSATVGASKSARSGSSTPKRVAHAARSAWVASSEWPPSAKKSSWTPIRPPVRSSPSTSVQSPASISSTGAARRHDTRRRPPARPARSGASARRSTLPFGGERQASQDHEGRRDHGLGQASGGARRRSSGSGDRPVRGR